MFAAPYAEPEQERLVTTVVRFRLPESPSHRRRRDLYESATPEGADVPGLIRKYFLGGDGQVGGLYFWEDRRAAERFFTEAWRKDLLRQFGVEPEVLFIERSGA